MTNWVIRYFQFGRVILCGALHQMLATQVLVDLRQFGGGGGDGANVVDDDMTSAHVSLAASAASQN